MKSRVITEMEKFKPLKIEITFESEMEVATFISRLNKELSDDELNGALPQYGYWNKSKVNSNNFEPVTKKRFQCVIDSIGDRLGWRREQCTTE